MPKVEPTSRITRFKIEEFEDLSKQIDKLYEKLADGINTKSDTVVRDEDAPTVDDIEFELGTMWVKSDTDQVYLLTSKTQTVATWKEI